MTTKEYDLDAIRDRLVQFARSMGGDLADGGVAAALIEQETAARECATPCSHEVDSSWWQDRWKEAATQRDEAKVWAGRWKEAARLLWRDEQYTRRQRDDARGDANDALSREKAEQDRAVKAEQARDNAMSRAEILGSTHRECHEQRDKALADLDEARQIIEARMGEGRGITAEDITDAMIRRTAYALGEWRMPATFEDDPDGVAEQFDGVARRLLTAALTEPPARPEGAEEIEALVDAWKLVPESPDCPRPTLADWLAERGVRVTGAES